MNQTSEDGQRQLYIWADALERKGSESKGKAHPKLYPRQHSYITKVQQTGRGSCIFGLMLLKEKLIISKRKALHKLKSNIRQLEMPTDKKGS